MVVRWLFLLTVWSPWFVHSTKSSSLVQNIVPSQHSKRMGYLDGFGKSKFVELESDDPASVLSSVRSSQVRKHKLCGALTITLLGSIASQSLWREGRGYWTAVGVFSVLYLVEAISCSTRRYLSNMLTPFQVIEMLHNLRDVMPTVRWDVECYHYQYTNAYHSSKGNRVRETRTKVVTHRASQDYAYHSCIDKTNLQPLVDALEYSDPSNQNPFLKISLGKLILFRDFQSYQDYINQFHLFLLREANRDTHTDTTTTVSVPTFFRAKLLAIRTVIGMRDYVGLLSFWIFTLLGMSYPYRKWFDTHCDGMDALIVKEVE